MSSTPTSPAPPLEAIANGYAIDLDDANTIVRVHTGLRHPHHWHTSSLFAARLAFFVNALD